MKRNLKLEAMIPLHGCKFDLEVLADDSGLQINVLNEGVCEARINVYHVAEGFILLEAKEHLTERVIIVPTEVAVE